VQNKNDPNDLTARTVPATNDFIIPSSGVITNRFSNIPLYNFTLSTPYLDVLTASVAKDTLFALRTVLNTSTNFNIFLEIELVQNVVLASLQNIYYFSSTIVVLAQKVDSSYTFFTGAIDPLFLKQIETFYPIGTSRISINGDDYVTASVGLPNQFTLGKYSTVTNSTNDPIRCIILVRAS
jgi:hypothetical protein